MTLHEAVQLFAKEVPEGYEATIRLENGAGWVELEYPNGETEQIDGQELTDMVLEALEVAKDHSKEWRAKYLFPSK